jgi:hypothetical protein
MLKETSTNNKQQTTNNKQQTTNNKKQKTKNKKQKTKNKKQKNKTNKRLCKQQLPVPATSVTVQANRRRRQGRLWIQRRPRGRRRGTLAGPSSTCARRPSESADGFRIDSFRVLLRDWQFLRFVAGFSGMFAVFLAAGTQSLSEQGLAKLDR